MGKSKLIKPDVYFKGPWASGIWKSRIFAVPRDANTLALCYNADMFRAKGLDPAAPPKTWSELTADAAKLKDPAKNVFGFGFSAMQAEEGVFQWLPFLYQAGGSIDHLDAPEAAQSLQLLVDFVKSGSASLDVLNQRQYEVTNTFMAGNTAMVMCGPWELPRLRNEAKFDWKLTLLPVKDGKDIHASSLGGYDWVVPKDAQNADGAFAFIEFMAQPQIVSEGWNTGRLPPRTDIVIDNPQWPQAYAIYHEQLQSARARGPHPQWPDLSRPMQTAIQEAITGKRTAAEALADAAKKVAADPGEDAVVMTSASSDVRPPPLAGGGWGRGARAGAAPSPNPLPQGEGENRKPCSTSSWRYRSSTCWRWSPSRSPTTS